MKIVVGLLVWLVGVIPLGIAVGRVLKRHSGGEAD